MGVGQSRILGETGKHELFVLCEIGPGGMGAIEGDGKAGEPVGNRNCKGRGLEPGRESQGLGIGGFDCKRLARYKSRKCRRLRIEDVGNTGRPARRLAMAAEYAIDGAK